MFFCFVVVPASKDLAQISYFMATNRYIHSSLWNSTFGVFCSAPLKFSNSIYWMSVLSLPVSVFISCRNVSCHVVCTWPRSACSIVRPSWPVCASISPANGPTGRSLYPRMANTGGSMLIPQLPSSCWMVCAVNYLIIRSIPSRENVLEKGWSQVIHPLNIRTSKYLTLPVFLCLLLHNFFQSSHMSSCRFWRKHPAGWNGFATGRYRFISLLCCDLQVQPRHRA